MEKQIISSSSGEEDLRQFCAKSTGKDAASLTKTQLLKFTYALLMNAGIRNQPVRYYQGRTYYFDEFGYYCSDNTSQRFPDMIYRNSRGQLRAKLWDMSAATMTTADARLNAHLWRKAVCSFLEGENLWDCLRKYLDTKINYYQTDMTYAESMITLISNPSIERAPGNSKKRTFDRIRVTVGLRSTMFYSFEDLRQAVIDHKQEIHQLVLEKIAESRNFKIYGVPINILSLSSLNLWHDHTLEYIFEPKQLTLDEKINSASSRVSDRSTYKPKTTKDPER